MEYDCLILGQGLAGTTLAWRLQQRGRRPLLFDRAEPVTASRIAAGLMTPITGQRLVLSDHWSRDWSTAIKFYRSIETFTGSTFLDTSPAIRWFSDGHERQRFLDRHTAGKFTGIDIELLVGRNDAELSAPHGGFQMSPAGRLNVAEYLTASARYFASCDALRVAELTYEDIRLTAQGVTIPSHDVSAKTLVFCEGAAAVRNPWFSNIDFRPAKGEILTVKLPAVHWTQTQHQGVWLAPWHAGLYRTGSTYEWQQLDQQPTAAARELILARLGGFVRTDVQIIAHAAAVRPAVSDAQPVIGRHAEHPQLAIMNGLGAKGSLWAPTVAGHLVDCLCDGRPIHPAFAASRWSKTSP